MTNRERALEAALRQCEAAMKAAPISIQDVRYGAFWQAVRQSEYALSLPPDPAPNVNADVLVPLQAVLDRVLIEQTRGAKEGEAVAQTQSVCILGKPAP